MQVKINSTMKQKEIQAMFDGQTHKDVTYHFSKKVGMSLIFDVENPTGKSADEVKAITKSVTKKDAMLAVMMLVIEVTP